MIIVMAGLPLRMHDFCCPDNPGIGLVIFD